MGDDSFNSVDFIHSNNLGIINISNFNIYQSSNNTGVSIINTIFVLINSSLCLDSLNLRFFITVHKKILNLNI